MNNQQTAESRIIAAPPVDYESGLLPYRIVIRDVGDQHVVHTEVLDSARGTLVPPGRLLLQTQRCDNARRVG